MLTIPKETIQALKKELPFGAMTEIAEELKVSVNYVSLVLKGEEDVKINDTSRRVLKLAQSIIRREREKATQLNEDLKKTLES